MNLSNLALKFNSLFTSGTFMYHASSMAANGDVVNTVETTSLAGGVLDMLVKGLINIVLKVIYTICAFLLNLIELFQFVVCQIVWQYNNKTANGTGRIVSCIRYSKACSVM